MPATRPCHRFDYAGRNLPWLQFSQPQHAEQGEITGIEFSYQQQFTFLAGLGADPVTDQCSDTFERLDAKASFAVTPNVSVYAEAQNLTDEPTGFHQNQRIDWTIQRERYGRTYHAGVSAKF